VGAPGRSHAQMPRLFDAHCHLQSPRLAPHLDAVLANAADAGIVGCAVNATCEDDWLAVLNLATAHPGVLAPSLGIHPWRLGGGGRAPGWEDRLRLALLAHPGAGVGESGLDAAPKGLAAAGRAAQAAALGVHLDLAASLGRPVSLHCVRSVGPLTEQLARRAPFRDGVVLHAWAGSPEATSQLAALKGVHFSVGARQLVSRPARGEEAAAQPVSPKAAAMLAAIPRGRLLVETDAPDGFIPGVGAGVAVESPGSPPSSSLLSPFRPALLNQPANLVRVVELVAEATGRGVDEVAAETCAAGERLFLWEGGH